MLDHVASAELAGDDLTLPDSVPMVTASWQAVEGVKLGEEESELGLQGKDQCLIVGCFFFSLARYSSVVSS